MLDKVIQMRDVPLGPLVLFGGGGEVRRPLSTAIYKNQAGGDP
jgi:hypothetical protein